MPADFDETGRALRSAFGGSESLVMEVLGQIRDNMRRMSEEMTLTRNSVEDVKGRVIALEERNRRLDEVEKKAELNNQRLDVIEARNFKQEGAKEVFRSVPKWVQFLLGLVTLCSAVSALYLVGRSTGVVPAPPTHVEATIQPDDRTITGKIGGKP